MPVSINLPKKVNINVHPSIINLKVESLKDVTIVNEIDGATLVFNSITGLFEIKPISITDAAVDGGTF
jgi:hypothetical protein